MTAVSAPILEVRDLSRRFGALKAVNHVSFAVAPGERRAIIGPNGAGKTTLFNLIAGELPASSGHVFLRGREVTHLPAHKRAQLGLARTFQRNNLFVGLSVRENVELAVRHRRGVTTNPFRPAAAYDAVAREAAEHLAHIGFGDRAALPVNALSYGEQRQLEVAVALASGPTVLLLDEPTAGMSPAETHEMTALVQTLPREVTVLVIEHDMDVVFALADRITVLHFGEVLADGTPAEVRENAAVQEAYLGGEALGVA